MPSYRRQQGFTLIETAIVVLIIGFIIAGILVGKDLIATANIRSTLTQIEQLNAQTNAFHSKYNGLPGDILETTAAGYGLYDSSATTADLGNGDGCLCYYQHCRCQHSSL